MRSLSLNKTEQVLACIVIFMALVSLLYQFAIIPELGHVRAARFQVNFQQDMLNTKVEEAQYRDALNNRIQKLKAEMAQTRRSLFSSDEARDFLRSLSQLIGQTGSTLTIITPYDMQDIPSKSASVKRATGKQQTAAAEGDGSFMTMPVRIAISGDYSEVIRFLEQLQVNRQLATVSKLKIATAQDPSEVSAELMVNLYVYEDEET